MEECRIFQKHTEQIDLSGERKCNEAIGLPDVLSPQQLSTQRSEGYTRNNGLD